MGDVDSHAHALPTRQSHSANVRIKCYATALYERLPKYRRPCRLPLAPFLARNKLPSIGYVILAILYVGMLRRIDISRKPRDLVLYHATNASQRSITCRSPATRTPFTFRTVPASVTTVSARDIFKRTLRTVSIVEYGYPCRLTKPCRDHQTTRGTIAEQHIFIRMMCRRTTDLCTTTHQLYEGTTHSSTCKPWQPYLLNFNFQLAP